MNVDDSAEIIIIMNAVEYNIFISFIQIPIMSESAAAPSLDEVKEVRDGVSIFLANHSHSFSFPHSFSRRPCPLPLQQRLQRRSI